MVQTALVFLLGFFFAGFLAFAVAPLIWQRAAKLTQLRIEASTPLTLNEVQADKDQQRAEFAMALRKVEIKSKKVNEERIAHMADAATSRELTRLSTVERDALALKAQAQAENLSMLENEALETKRDIEFLETARSALEKQVAELESELLVRTKVINDQQIEADHKRIEYVARMTEREQIKARVSQLVEGRKSLEEKLRTGNSEVRTLREAARLNAKKMLEIERKAERLVSQLSDREEQLERRNKELARLKDAAKSNLQDSVQHKTKVASVAAEIVSIPSIMTKPLGAAPMGLTKPQALEPQATNALTCEAGEINDDKLRLLSIKSQVNDEKDALVKKLQGASSKRGSVNDDQLRAQIRDLTAKVVSFTAQTEGTNSPIGSLLEKTKPTSDARQMIEWQDGKIPESLAERIMALQKSAQGV